MRTYTVLGSLNRWEKKNSFPTRVRGNRSERKRARGQKKKMSTVYFFLQFFFLRYCFVIMQMIYNNGPRSAFGVGSVFFFSHPPNRRVTISCWFKRFFFFFLHTGNTKVQRKNKNNQKISTFWQSVVNAI